MIFVTHTLKHSVQCGIHCTPEGRQVKMACHVPCLCQFFPIQAWFSGNYIYYFMKTFFYEVRWIYVWLILFPMKTFGNKLVFNLQFSFNKFPCIQPSKRDNPDLHYWLYTSYTWSGFQFSDSLNLVFARSN